MFTALNMDLSIISDVLQCAGFGYRYYDSFLKFWSLVNIVKGIHVQLVLKVKFLNHFHAHIREILMTPMLMYATGDRWRLMWYYT